MNVTPKLGVTPSAHFSVHHAHPYWYIACQSSELGDQPLSVRLWDTPLVVFRDEAGAPHALVDRCAHRNAPLSGGRCREGRIECPYHGWQFDGEGACKKIPALVGEPAGKARRVPAFPVREQQGFVWVYTDTATSPNHEPFKFPCLEDGAYTHVRHVADFKSTLHGAAENILDVPHTAFLHKGLFRGGSPNSVQTVVRRYEDRVECQFMGEPRPSGWLAKVLAPGAGEVVHYDRFILPGVAQVDYSVGESGHLVTTSCLTPVSDFVTRMYSVLSVRLGKWVPMLRPVIVPMVMKVIQQDAWMLEKQSRAILEFGGEQFVSTDVDLLGPSITRLLKQASAGQMQIHPSVEGQEAELVSSGELLA
ncbi:MAG: aromatic ring-hydroxylating dioxygenase subunit alpha [Myxococcota bacterium]|nr:aromatic ring-hydroxylating dioxygenase subunit alpha [Myxococcota bacterium]